MAKGRELSFGEITETITDGLNRAAKTPNIHGYRPHSKQIRFHTSNAKGRLYIGGNRSGKTVGGVNEDIWWLLGKHPYKRTPEPPIRGRIVGVDFDYGVEQILKPQFQRWLPPSALINGSWTDSYRAGTRELTLENGSTLEFMSYVQDVKKFAGTSRHFIHFDEEPPKSIYTECKARLVDTAGSWWITETPVEGMTWVYDDIYIPGTTDPTGEIQVIQVDITENPYITRAEIDGFLAGLDATERRARGKGEFVHLGGLIFKQFRPDIHVIDAVPHNRLLRLKQWASLDHGLNNATAWLWHAVFPDGSVLTFDEHFESGWTVSQHASRVHLLNQEHGRPPNYYVGDPAIKQRNAETGHSIQYAYMKDGIPVVLANNEVRAGIDRMSQYLNEKKWLITANCINLIWEMQRYRWKVRESQKLRDKENPLEEPVKKDDHAIDSSRYFFSFMPNLEWVNPHPDYSEANHRYMAMLGAKQGHDVTQGMRDPNWSRPSESTQWTAVDEFVGEY